MYIDDLVICYAPYIQVSHLFQGDYKEQALEYFADNAKWSWGDACHTLILKQYFVKHVENMRLSCPKELVSEFDFVLMSLLNVGPGVCIDLES